MCRFLSQEQLEVLWEELWVPCPLCTPRASQPWCFLFRAVWTLTLPGAPACASGTHLLLRHPPVPVRGPLGTPSLPPHPQMHTQLKCRQLLHSRVSFDQWMKGAIWINFSTFHSRPIMAPHTVSSRLKQTFSPSNSKNSIIWAFERPFLLILWK